MHTATAAAPPAAAAPATAALDPRRAAPDTVRLGLASALLGATLVGVLMCVFAAALTFFILAVTPPPAGARDAAGEMAWARAAPFSAQHGACVCLRRVRKKVRCAYAAACSRVSAAQTTLATSPPPT
jgi:hypothetical protein